MLPKFTNGKIALKNTPDTMCLDKIYSRKTKIFKLNI